jgi:alpha 1,2-mannosyltransferase
MGYEWVARLDDDSLILSPINYNIFAFMEQNDLDYGYRIATYEPQEAKFYEFVRNFIKLSGMKQQDQQGLLDTCRDKSGAYTASNCMGHRPGIGYKPKKVLMGPLAFYSNFFVGRISRFLEPDMQSYLRAFDESGKMFTRRWGDLNILSVGIQLLFNKSAVHQFTGWSYFHNSGGSSKWTWGSLQTGQDFGSLQKQENELQRVHTEIFGWPAKSHMISIQNNFGGAMTAVSEPAQVFC